MNKAEQEQLDAAGVDWDTSKLDESSVRGFQHEPAKKLGELPCASCSRMFFYSACDSRRYCQTCLCVKISELSGKALYFTRKTCPVCASVFCPLYYDKVLCPTCYNYSNTAPG
jgi:hypothetical protein